MEEKTLVQKGENGQPCGFSGKHVLQWHITHRCNLRCKHCYQDDYSAETDVDVLFGTLDKYVRFLKKKGLAGQINLTGGEPLVSPHFFCLAEEIVRRGIAFSVLTNGTLITEETAARLSVLKPEFVQISLDGGPVVHDAIRGEGVSRMAYAGIDLLKKYGVRVIVSFTVQRKNLMEFGTVARIASRHGVDKLWWDRVIIPKADDADRQMLTPVQFRLFARYAARVSKRYEDENGKSFVACVRGLQFLWRKGASPYTCSAGKDVLIIKADGGVMPCRRLPYTIGNIRDGEIEEIVAASPVMDQLANASVPEKCRTCRHAETCRGGSKCVICAKTGAWYGKDPDCPM